MPPDKKPTGDSHALHAQLRSALSALCLVLESCGDRDGAQRIRAYVEGRYPGI